MRRSTLVLAIIVGFLAVLGTATGAYAHDERDTVPPDGSGTVPTYRTTGQTLLVCKTDKTDFDQRIFGFPADLKAANEALWTQCQTTGHRNLQDAVNAVNAPDMIIKILPGIYLEEPSLAAPAGECANLPARKADAGYQVLSWDQQVACPHNQNLVAVLDKKNLQIEGTGAKPDDVILDAQFKRLNAVRADRSSGIYLRNFTVQKTTFNAVYIMESDGFVIDRMIGRWNDEYGFLTFADDHGLYTDCEAYGNGDSGLYPGAPSNINADKEFNVDRYAIEIRNCYSHHNLLGYSGTAGNSVWAHDNRFTENTVGVATDSAFPGHPGLPQNHALFEKNEIGDNNQDYYRYVRDGTCAKPSAERAYETGVVCPAVGVPPGTGVINPGGNYNTWRANYVYNNAYAGFVTSWVPAIIRGDKNLGDQFDTSHHNRYYDNHLGEKPDGTPAANGMDFWWDGQGAGSCWQQPNAAEPRVLPRCDESGFPARFGTTARYVAEPTKMLKLYACTNYDLAAQQIPGNCDWFGATGLRRIDVQFALAEAILFGLILIVLWWRTLRTSGVAFVGLVLALTGFGVGVYGTMRETSLFPALGLLLLGLGWLACSIAMRRRGRPGLGFLTLALAFFALLGALDRGLYMIPFIPVPPSVWRLMLEVFWLPAALLAIMRGKMMAASTVDVPPPTGDGLESYAARLRF